MNKKPPKNLQDSTKVSEASFRSSLGTSEGMTLTSRILPPDRGQTGKSHLLRVLEDSEWAIKLCLMVDIMASQPTLPPRK